MEAREKERKGNLQKNFPQWGESRGMVRVQKKDENSDQSMNKYKNKAV